MSGQLNQPAEAKVPPSGWSVVPVTYDDRPEARNTTQPDTSVGTPTRPMGTAMRAPTGSPSDDESAEMSPMLGVGVMSGATLLTLMPSGATSRARLRAKWATPALAAEYTAKLGAARWASMVVRLTMLPPRPPARMRGTASEQAWKTWSRLARSRASHPRGLVSVNCARNVPPT